MLLPFHKIIYLHLLLMSCMLLLFLLRPSFLLDHDLYLGLLKGLIILLLHLFYGLQKILEHLLLLDVDLTFFVFLVIIFFFWDLNYLFYYFLFFFFNLINFFFILFFYLLNYLKKNKNKF